MKRKTLQPRILHPARLSFRFDGEIKSFPDKQKLKRIQHHQTIFTTNAKGTSLGRKQKKENTYLQKINSTIKKTVIGSHILIITLYVNGLNTPTKRQRLAEDMKICAYVHSHLPHRSAWSFNCNYFILLG